MPISPAPGRAISVGGLNKTSGWGSRNATGNLIAGHEPDQGINHVAGLSESGVDTAANPLVTTFGVGSITTTAATVTWTSNPAAPLGSVVRRALGAATTTTTAETGSPPLTAHSVALSGLTADTVYDLLITQPGSGQGRTEFVLRFRTGPTGMVLSAPAAAVQSAGQTTAGGEAPAAGTPPEGGGATPGLAISNVSVAVVDATTVEVTWRTDAYADGQVDWDGGGETGSEGEGGNKRLNHVVVLAGLNPGTVYALTVTSQDASGTEASAEATVETPTA